MIQLFSNNLGDEELSGIRDVFESKWLGNCDKTKEFEAEFKKKLNHPSFNVLSTNSCTAATIVALKTLGIGPGDEVIIPSINFVGCANAVIMQGATPIFCDVDPEYWNASPVSIEQARTPKTKAIILLHYGGHPCNMDAIWNVCGGLFIIEDSANSISSYYKGKHCGTLGHAGVWSFDAMKTLVTGDGGMLAIRNSLYHKAQAFRYLGLTRKSGIDSVNEERWWEYQLDEISDRNLMNDITAVMGLAQLKKLPRFIERRKAIWETYQREFKDCENLILPPEPLPGTESSYYFYWLKIKDGRDELARELVKNGVYCTFRYYPLHLIDKYKSNNKPLVAHYLKDVALNIPFHQNLSDVDIELIVNLTTDRARRIK